MTRRDAREHALFEFKEAFDRLRDARAHADGMQFRESLAQVEKVFEAAKEARDVMRQVLSDEYDSRDEVGP
jgi:hypothetical protein